MDQERAAVDKAFRRIVPWCTALYVISYIDRVNIGFAALSMNKALGLSATTFGIANTILFIMYTAFEVPSSMLLVRLGIRRWLPAILFSWGLASICTMFAVGPYSLYGLRGLVGIAEAGLMPGMLYYLSRWFPAAHRARANAWFLSSLPLSLVIGGPLSGAILGMDGVLGLSGWRWLFLLEGLPSLAAAAAVLLWLPSVPADARWLTDMEKRALQARLDAERRPPNATASRSWRDIVNAPVIVLAAAFFCVIATANTLGVWTPQIVKEMMGSDRPLLIGLFTAVPPAFAIVVMQLLSRHSDRTGERTGHLIGAMIASAAGWVLVVVLPIPALKLLGLALCACGAYSAMAIFWATTTRFLAHRSQAVGMAAIQSVANCASIVSPTIIGVLRDATANFYAGIWYTTVLMAIGIGLITVAARAPATATSP